MNWDDKSEESWHWERDEYKSPIIWLLWPWLLVIGAVAYLAWQFVR